MAPTICATIRPANEIHADRTLSFFVLLLVDGSRSATCCVVHAPVNARPAVLNTAFKHRLCCVNTHVRCHSCHPARPRGSARPSLSTRPSKRATGCASISRPGFRATSASRKRPSGAMRTEGSTSPAAGSASRGGWATSTTRSSTSSARTSGATCISTIASSSRCRYAPASSSCRSASTRTRARRTSTSSIDRRSARVSRRAAIAACRCTAAC